MRVGSPARPVSPQPLALGLDGEGIVGEFGAHHLHQPPRIRVQQIPGPGVVAKMGALLAGQAEGDRGLGEREPAQRVGGVAQLGARRFEEFEPRRRRVEEIAHLDPGAGGERGGAGAADRPPFDRDDVRLGRAPGAAGDGEAADRADRGQRLAAETERVDPRQIVVRQLGGRVPLDRQRELFRRHAASVVGDRDQRPPAVAQHHVDAPRAGVDRVLDQLLDRRGGALHHLARGDAVDQGRRQAPDGHGASAGAEAAR